MIAVEAAPACIYGQATKQSSSTIYVVVSGQFFLLRMFARKKITGVRGTLTLYRTLHILGLPACIVWLYYAPRSTLWWFPDHFFYLVCGLLGRKKKTNDI
jgi:hypothetical protein